jgi:hypothetical protein
MARSANVDSMPAVWMRVMAVARSRWRSWIILALLIALAGGGVLSLAAGARRTQTAYSRFETAQRAADVILYMNGGTQTPVGAIEHLPEVAEFATSVALSPTEASFSPVVLTDARLGRDINRFKMLAGRLPRKPDEVAIGFLMASSQNLHVGDLLQVQGPAVAAASRKGIGESADGRLTWRVVGIEAAPGEFPPSVYSSQQIGYLSAAFLGSPLGETWQRLSGGTTSVAVRLHNGAHQMAPFLAGAERLAGGPLGTATLSDQAAQVQSSMHLQALALWLMAGFLVLAVALVVAQLFLRELSEDASDHPALRALGMTSRGLTLSATLQMAVVIVVGVAGAIALAYGLSPVFPLGTAGIAEPDPGPSFDVLALTVGGIGLLLALGVLVVVTAWWATVQSRATNAGSLGTDFGHRIRQGLPLGVLPIAVTTGFRMALDPGRGRSAVPVRATAAAAIIAVGAMITAVTFGASLGHLLTHPRLYGTAYDADVQLNQNFGDIRTILPVLRADTSISALAIAESGIPLRSGRVSFGAVATTNIVGTVEPTLVEGSLPRTAGEIDLGSRTMADLHSRIGARIPVAVEGLTRPLLMRVVGRVVLSPVSDTQGLGHGAVVSNSALGAFESAILTGLTSTFHAPPPGDAFVRFSPGVSRDEGIAMLEQRLGGTGTVLVTAPTEPSDVVNFGQVRDLPQLLAGLLGAVATLTLAHLLVTAVRRRRRDLAVFKTLGFVPRQVSAAVAWQATALSVLALIIGIPVGIAAGRFVWSLVATNIGVVVEPTVPWVWVGVIVPATLLIANLVAAGPAAAAARVAPSTVLRSE